MTTCTLCKKHIEPGTAAVSIVGGMFPREDPEFFMVDEQVLQESHAHLQCLIANVRGTQNAPRSDPGAG